MTVPSKTSLLSHDDQQRQIYHDLSASSTLFGVDCSHLLPVIGRGTVDVSRNRAPHLGHRAQSTAVQCQQPYTCNMIRQHSSALSPWSTVGWSRRRQLHSSWADCMPSVRDCPLTMVRKPTSTPQPSATSYQYAAYQITLLECPKQGISIQTKAQTSTFIGTSKRASSLNDCDQLSSSAGPYAIFHQSVITLMIETALSKLQCMH